MSVVIAGIGDQTACADLPAQPCGEHQGFQKLFLRADEKSFNFKYTLIPRIELAAVIPILDRNMYFKGQLAGSLAAASLVAFVLATFSTKVTGQTNISDRVRNVERAAAEIGVIQKKSGANGAFAAIYECYKRELAHATALTPQLEACMAQDIVVSQVAASFYSKIKAGSEEPGAILKAMTERVVGTMARFKVPESDARAFAAIAKKQGMEAYGRAQFPDQFPPKKN